MPTLGFIGTGNMGGALARAAAKKKENLVLLTNRTQAKAEALAAQIGGRAVTPQEAVAQADYLFLGVKPQMLPGLCETLAPLLRERKDRFVIITMAAGTSREKLLGLLGLTLPVIRIMPNTPASIGQGMILYSPGADVTEAEETAFVEAMAGAGRFLKLEEKLIDAGSALSGSGPAFVDLFLEALADGGVACGLPRAKALSFAADMLEGAAALAGNSEKHPGALKDAVCSPAGSTIAGVRTLEQRAFRAAVMDAVIAATERTKELGKK